MSILSKAPFSKYNRKEKKRQQEPVVGKLSGSYQYFLRFVDYTLQTLIHVYVIIYIFCCTIFLLLSFSRMSS